MADEAKKFTTREGSILSKVGSENIANQRKAASSTEAAQSGSTTTPTVTDTPKVTQTAKAMPSITRPDISSIASQYQTPITTTQIPTDLLSQRTVTLKKAETPDLLSKKAEDISPVPGNIIASSNSLGGGAEEAVNKTILNQFTDWFNNITKKSEEDSQYYANKLAQSWVGGLGGAIFDLGGDVVDYATSALGYYSNKAIDTVAKSLGARETSITRERNKYWEEKFTPEEREETSNALKKLGVGAMNIINDTEYWVAGLADVIETSLGGEGGFKKAFQEQQGWFWDAYAEENELESAKLYEEDKQAQNVTESVSNWLYDKTGDEGLSNMLGSVAGHVYANLKDPGQVAYTVGYMAPALIMQYAMGGGFRAGTAIWTPSQSASVYKDYSTDPELSKLYTDNQLFGISTAFGTILSMVEQFGDAVGDMPWAKSMSRSIRNTFKQTMKKEIKKGFTKEIADNIDKNVIKSLRNPIKNALSKWFKGGLGEGIEEMVQDTIQTEGARALGSKREGMSFERLLTTGLTATGIGWIVQGPGVVVNIKQNKDLKKEYDEFSDTIDKIAPGIEEETKEAFFSAMITSQQKDTNLSEKRVEKYEAQTTQLYNEKSDLEQQLESTTNENTKSQINQRITQIDNEIKDIDKKINQRNNTREEINKAIEEYNQQRELEEELPATQKGMQLPKEEGGENLSQQTMVKVSEEGFDKDAARQSFENSVKQIIQEKKDYTKTEFANYAYYNTTKNVVSTKERMQLVDKVENLLNNIGIYTRYVTEQDEDLEGAEGLYERGKKRVTYLKDDNNVPIYGHEVFHAMMDVINNYTITDRELQKKLKSALKKAINDVKEQFGIDIYKSGTKEYKYANIYAEEWLANSFGEYLAGRELAGPKTFVQRIKDFFNDIIDWFLGNERLISRELEKAFDAIADGKVVKAEGGFTVTPIEVSTEFTQRELRNVEGYIESQEENALQTKQQNELGEHRKEIVEAGKESDFENEIYNDSMNVEVSEDVLSGRASITPKVIKDAFGKNKKKRFKALSIMKTEALQGVKDILTPAKTRIFNISPRIGGRLIQMETQRDIYTHRYRERAKPFVEAISKLDDKAKLEIKKALLDYGALAYEQGENIEQYKQEEVAKLKEVLNKYGISEKATNDMFAMLNELGQRYKDAGLSITLSDIYFPRTVTDYEGLQEYISNVTGILQEEKATLLKRIQDITIDNKLTEEEKEKKIRHWMTTDYHEPGKTSKNAKERKMGLLSEWGEGIYQFYGDPIEALDSYIVTMEDAIQKQLFLGGLQEDAGLKGENVSLEEILMGLVREGKISNEKLKELKESVSSVLNKKPTPKIVKTAKSIIHIGLLANFISGVTQFDDLGVVILKDRKGFINICKAFFGKAGIQYTELGLENSYEIFRDQLNITNWFFAKSFFNAIDRLGKTSFINTAWDSLKRQAKKTKDGKDTRARANLIKRLTDMYGEETANHIMEKIDSDNYMTNGQVDIDVLTDLLYLLSETQPLYTSDMPTAYLNNGWVRICYSLQSFLIKRINMLIQGTKQVYENNGGGAVGTVKAGTWLMYTTAFLAIRGAMIGDAQDFLKGDKDETALYKLITEGIDKALDQLWKDSKGSWLKIWNLSDYDKKIYDRQGAWGWLMSKFEPPIIGMGADLLEAITEHNKDEITDLAKYVPIIGKLFYYWFWDELGKDTNKSKWDWGEEKQWNWGDNKEWNWGEEKEWNWD